MRKEKSVMAEFGEQLRKAREEKGMTQQTLAEKLYVTRQTVSRWESGDRFPDLVTAKRISQVLEVSISKLFSEEEPVVIVERTQVIEDPIANRIAIALYACIVLAYSAAAMSVMLHLKSVLEVSSTQDIFITLTNTLCRLIPAVGFFIGLVLSLKGTLTPKRTGLIIAAYFAASALMDGAKITVASSDAGFVVAVLTMMNVVGMFAAFRYFSRNTESQSSQALLYLVSFAGILRAVFSTVQMLRHAYSYVSLETILGVLLTLCVNGLILYQVYSVDRKRRIAVELAN